MADREAMKTLIKEAYAARDRGDVNGLMAAFHSDASFELVGAAAALEVTGAVNGHARVQTSMRGFIDVFKFEHREILSEVFDGEQAAVHSRFTVTFIPNGKTFTSEVLDLFRFADGKIIELREFADTALIRDVISAA
jgi:ketosteroid isomerase-like protein